MPRFFFDIASPTNFTTDDLGVELHDLDHVRSEAVKGARGLMAQSLRAGEPIDHQRFEVRDAGGSIVFKLAFRDVLDVPAELSEQTSKS